MAEHKTIEDAVAVKLLEPTVGNMPKETVQTSECLT